MYRARFADDPSKSNGRRNGYASAVVNGRGGNSNGRSGPVQDTEESLAEGMRAVIQDDQRTRAANSKFLYGQKLIMEAKRKHLAKGLILTFTLKRENCSYPFMGKVLRECGFLPNQVKALKLNEYRSTEAEVLFVEGTVFNIQEIQNKLQVANLDVTVSTFEGDEEVIILEGLPLTEDHETMKKLIKDAVWPFVKKVKEIIPTTYRLEEEFFKGMYDGKYKLIVTPRYGKEVPNFIAIGPENAAGRVIYTKSRAAKKVMCQNCYIDGHTSRDTNSCSGPRTWDEYVSEFNVNWKAAAESSSGTAETEENTEIRAEIENYSRAVVVANAAAEEKISVLEIQIANSNENVENLIVENQELKEQVEQKDQEIQKLEKDNEMILKEVVSEATSGGKVNDSGDWSDSQSESQTITPASSQEDLDKLGVVHTEEEWQEVIKKRKLTSPVNNIKDTKKPKYGDEVACISQLEIDEFYEIQSSRGSFRGLLNQVKDERMYVTSTKKVAGKNIKDIFDFKNCIVKKKRKPSTISFI